MHNPLEKLITVTEASHLLKLSASMVRQLHRDGKLSAFVTRKGWRFFKEHDVLAGEGAGGGAAMKLLGMRKYKGGDCDCPSCVLLWTPAEHREWVEQLSAS